MYLPDLLRLSAVPIARARHEKLLQNLSKLEAPKAVDVLITLRQELKTQSRNLSLLHLDFVTQDLWHTRLSASQRNEMRIAAQERQDPILPHALWIRRAAACERDVPTSARLFLSKLTLGEKKQLGRLGSGKQWLQLMYDAHPDVIAQLLINTRATERDVTRMIHMALHHPDLLAQVCRHEKWMRLSSVKRALLCHQALPTHVFAWLLPHVSRQDLNLIAERNAQDPVKFNLVEQFRELT